MAGRGGPVLLPEFALNTIELIHRGCGCRVTYRQVEASPQRRRCALCGDLHWCPTTSTEALAEVTQRAAQGLCAVHLALQTGVA